jgi:RNA polymerase sigma-70 factor, ECF subfamily
LSAFAGANSLPFDEPKPVENRTVWPQADGFAAFVTRNVQFAYRVAYTRLRHVADAEDAVQDAFLKLMAKDRWQTAENERAFVATVVWRAAGERLRRGRVEVADSSLLDTEESPQTGPELQVMHAAEHAQMHKLIDTLPETLRAPLVLAVLEEMTSREVAAVLGLPEGTVRRRITEARQLLREKWKQMGEPHGLRKQR